MDRVQRDRETGGIPPCAIIVMGVSGSGKSTLGQLLATALDCPFIEADTLHDLASVAKMRAGQPLCDEDRWPWLDRLGAALREATGTRGLAVAACSALRLCYRERLAQAVEVPTRFIMLETNRDELARRIASRADHYMPASLLASQLAALERPGSAEQALILDATRSPEALCDVSRDWLSRDRA